MAQGKLIVALSGGVDSTAAALLTRDAGYECTAVFLRLYDDTAATAEVAEGAAEAVTIVSEAEAAATAVSEVKAAATAVSEAEAAAAAVSAHLGIPFQILDFRDIFKDKVIDPYIFAYRCGDTQK